jgi:hypothetical protein
MIIYKTKPKKCPYCNKKIRCILIPIVINTDAEIFYEAVYSNTKVDIECL